MSMSAEVLSAAAVACAVCLQLQLQLQSLSNVQLLACQGKNLVINSKHPVIKHSQPPWVAAFRTEVCSQTADMRRGLQGGCLQELPVVCGDGKKLKCGHHCLSRQDGVNGGSEIALPGHGWQRMPAM